METFEKYVHSNIPDNVLQDIIKSVNEIGLSKLTKIVRKKTNYLPPRDAYDVIRIASIQNYYCYKNYSDKFTEDVSDFNIIIHGIYELDVTCGIDDTLNPHLSQKEELKILTKLDEDELKFGNILKKYLVLFKNSEMKKLFKSFAKLIFMFNGYQAPERTDPQQAVRDSLGMSDLFGEFISGIESEIEEKNKH
jgi:hypothetical protein